MLCSAEDKAHYAENDPKVFSYLVAVILKSFNCDVNKEVTEYSQDKEANVRVSQLYIAKAKGFLWQAGNPGLTENSGHKKASHQVTQPN